MRKFSPVGRKVAAWYPESVHQIRPLGRISLGIWTAEVTPCVRLVEGPVGTWTWQWADTNKLFKHDIMQLESHKDVHSTLRPLKCTFLFSFSHVVRPFSSTYWSPKNHTSLKPMVFTTWKDNQLVYHRFCTLVYYCIEDRQTFSTDLNHPSHTKHTHTDQ